MDIYDYAMKMEFDGKTFYEKLAAECNSEGLCKIFSELALDEQKHFDIFRQLKNQKSVDSMANSSALDGARNIFAEMQADLETQKQLKTNIDGYRFAMKAEKESAELYLDAAEKETDPKVKNLLLRIAAEEQKHLNILENIYEFVNTPDCTLVWGEWSNLDDV